MHWALVAPILAWDSPLAHQNLVAELLEKQFGGILPMAGSVDQAKQVTEKYYYLSVVPTRAMNQDAAR